MDADKAASVCRALGDPNRLRIVGLLAQGERCACKLLEALEITQPTLSHHMAILCECGLVTARREGKWTHYSLSCGTLAEFKDFVSSLECSGEGCR